MKSTQRMRRWAARGGLALAVLGLLVAPVSHAQVSLDEVVKGTVATTKASQDKPPKDEKDKSPKVSVPEPDVNVLLVLGLGVTGLVAYGVNRRKRIA
jgi:hypothetical protein